jgi:hypothetical protein
MRNFLCQIVDVFGDAVGHLAVFGTSISLKKNEGFPDLQR